MISVGTSAAVWTTRPNACPVWNQLVKLTDKKKVRLVTKMASLKMIFAQYALHKSLGKSLAFNCLAANMSFTQSVSKTC